MEISGQAVLLRIFVGESDKLGHQSLYESIVRLARDADLACAQVLHGLVAAAMPELQLERVRAVGQ